MAFGVPVVVGPCVVVGLLRAVGLLRKASIAASNAAASVATPLSAVAARSAYIRTGVKKSSCKTLYHSHRENRNKRIVKDLDNKGCCKSRCEDREEQYLPERLY